MAGKLTGPPGWAPDSSMAPPSLDWKERGGFRPSTFGTKFSDTKGGEALKPGAFEETNRAARAKAKEFVTEEDVKSFQVRPAHQPPQEPAEKTTRAAWDETMSNLLDAAESGTAGLHKSNKEKLAEYLAASKVNTARARDVQKTAKQEARWAAQDERDAKVKVWLEGKTVDEVNQLVSSEKFLGLPEIAQERIFAALDELGYEAQAETDLAIQQIEGEEFTLPAPEYAAVLPWENRAEQVDDEVEEDYSDDEDDSTEFAGGRF
jgi:hypothetical protein